MKYRAILRRLRLLPAVMALGGLLLVIKSVGIVVDARAQEQQSPASAAPGTTLADANDPANDPAADDADASSAQVDVLTSLAKRRTELDARERDLDMRENLIAAAEKRVDSKIDSLKQLQSQIQGLLVQRDAADQKSVDSLVKTYASMKPRDAARIFDNLDDDVLLSVAAQMKPDVLGAILAAMQPDNAQKLTLRIANRLKLPPMAAMQAPPAQVAAVTPPSATSSAPPSATSSATPAATAPVAQTAPAATPAPAAAKPATAAPQTPAPGAGK